MNRRLYVETSVISYLAARASRDVIISIVFNIAGNSYRLIASFNYKYQAGYIKFFGTHAEYDNVDASTVDHTGAHHGKARR